jgi:hypothetical protein
MRTLVDAICPGCGDVHSDVWMDTGATSTLPQCRRCGCALTRSWRRVQAPGVIPDGIPGGVWIEHGLCNPDGSPRRYDSKSEMAAEAKRRHLTQHVEHRGSEGSDRSAHTSRWI